MAIQFEALEPSFSLVGNAPVYKVRFLDSITNQPVDPDSVDRLEVLDSLGNILRSYTPPQILNTAVGNYEVQEIILPEAGTLGLRWIYTVGANQTILTVPFQVTSAIEGVGEARIKAHVLAMLGEGRMKVELPAGTLDFCLFFAQQALLKQLTRLKRIDIQVLPNQSKYELPADVYFVTNVAFEHSLNRIGDALGAYGIYGFSQLGLSSVPTNDLLHSFSAHGFYGSLVQSLQYASMGQRILSGEPAWEWLRSERRLYLYPCPAGAQTASVEYGSTQVDLDNLYPEEYFFLQQLTLAEAMIALGRIRSKFDSFPSAEGTVNLDGDALKSEGDILKQTTMESLRQYAPQGWIVRG